MQNKYKLSVKAREDVKKFSDTVFKNLVKAKQ